MLQNASLLAIVAVDTEENEPIKDEVWWVRRHFLRPSHGPGEHTSVIPVSFRVVLAHLHNTVQADAAVDVCKGVDVVGGAFV